MQVINHKIGVLGKSLVVAASLFMCIGGIAGCSTNPATGARQFTAFMSEDKENKVGAEEHQKIIKQYGLYKNAALQAYVDQIGARVTADTERPDVQYSFHILDSPIVNAFALPGGYIYVSRGLLALANSEAELAGVLAHEAGHITARHSAERYSHGMVTSVGSSILSVLIGSQIASQALDVGANLYMSGYSRSQENEADALGVRYMSAGGYRPESMSDFLAALGEQKNLALEGKKDPSNSYFSTHPPTPERVEKTAALARDYAGREEARSRYLNAIDGMVYGDSAQQGFQAKGRFYHAGLDFTFVTPKNYKLVNTPTKVALKDRDSDAMVVFDLAKAKDVAAQSSALTYLKHEWLKGQNLDGLREARIHGKRGATARYNGRVNGQSMQVEAYALPWGQGRYARFLVAYPKDASVDQQAQMRRVPESMRGIASHEKSLKPAFIRIVTAMAGDSVRGLASRQMFAEDSEAYFRVLNGLRPDEALQAGRRYKLIVQ